ncbi:helicase C-terminal domain-containing protein [Natronocalculus amylovorans]|uniref:ATP-dependent DNA helicase n=1 Tax=Natronocalculus amylovorans TaxID=2917812 RepID=A0AAE3K7D7_9EURY|nr:ATP-dependent DNA helicase [Natronocalculus amylovorans]MCL9815921.1 ATP-dependent DNA helicase [Natronocalculus amylovorans]
MQPARIFEAFPAPSYRGAQKQALTDIKAAFDAGNDVVLVRAPTGSGKSLLARAIMGCARSLQEADPAQATGAYYTTPQVSQLDDVADDDLLDDLNVIRGKSNYNCILPGEHSTPVTQAPCVRQRGYDCTVKHRCPYYSDRAIASSREIAAMTLAYFMQTAGSEIFRKRDVVVIDEAHGLAEWAEMYATIELTPARVPVWESIGVPAVHAEGDPIDRTARFAETLVGVCSRAKDELTGRPELSPDEVARRDRLNELISELNWFVEDYRDPESPTTWVVDQPDGEGTSLTIKPLDPARYLHHTVWDRGNKFALLSATILNKDAFCRGVGLAPSRVALVDVPHTFPLKNRPIYDVTQGKMTFEHRTETIPQLARVIVQLMAQHPDEKGLIHAHSYSIAEELTDRLYQFGVGERVRSHTSQNRDAELDSWKATDRPDVFVSVKMEEALDLKDDLARWQLLCKAPYLNTNDSRVARRLEDGQWPWYHRAALRTVIQGCGRVVRAPEDYGATYLGDSSLLDLFDRAASDTPPWFQAGLDAMTTPSLPPFDPDAALSAYSGSAAPTQRAGRSSPSASRSLRSTNGTSQGENQQPGRSASRKKRHPLSDVWGDE